MCMRSLFPRCWVKLGFEIVAVWDHDEQTAARQSTWAFAWNLTTYTYIIYHYPEWVFYLHTGWLYVCFTEYQIQRICPKWVVQQKRSAECIIKESQTCTEVRVAAGHLKPWEVFFSVKFGHFVCSHDPSCSSLALSSSLAASKAMFSQRKAEAVGVPMRS